MSVFHERCEKAERHGALTTAEAGPTVRGRDRRIVLCVGVDLAERNGETLVMDDHIESARNRVQRGRLENKIRDQTEHGQYILEAIANLQTRGEVPALSKGSQ